MKILLLSDAHGNTSKLQALKETASSCDCIIYAGDFSAMNKPETAKPVLDVLLELNDVVFAITGNVDEPAFLEVLEAKDVSIEKNLVSFEKLLLAGSGGASFFQHDTPNERSEEDLLSDFDLIREESFVEIDFSEEENLDETVASKEEVAQNTKGTKLWDNLILVSHNPPKDVSCDKISAGFHVGSQLLREFIEEEKPLLVVCGHIHEAASIDYIGETVVINPGSIGEGNYAIVELQGGVKAPFSISKKNLFKLD